LEIAVAIFISGALINDEIAMKLSSFKNLRVQVDLDSSISKHHDLQRGLSGDFEKTVRGIKTLIDHGMVPQIAMIITKHNLDDIGKTADFVHKLGIKYFFLGPTGYFYGNAYKNKEVLRLNKNEIKKLKENLLKAQKKYEGDMVVALST